MQFNWSSWMRGDWESFLPWRRCGGGRGSWGAKTPMERNCWFFQKWVLSTWSLVVFFFFFFGLLGEEVILPIGAFVRIFQPAFCRSICQNWDLPFESSVPEIMDFMPCQVSFYFTLEKGTAVVDFRAWGMWLAMKVKTTTGGLILCKDGDCSEEFCFADSNCAEGYQCCTSDFTFKCGKIYRPGFSCQQMDQQLYRMVSF